MELIVLENIQKSFIDEKKPTIRSILSKKQKRIIILSDISFEVESGELIGIIGKNGVGKSTLLRLIGGVYEKDSGSLITNGEIVSIFEMGSFFSVELTGEQYCKDYFRFRGLKGNNLEEVVKAICDFTELGDYFFEPIKTYSSGMKAKLLFGTATAIPAKIILIDEFLLVGDEYFQGKAWNRLKKFLSLGATGIIVSHDWTSLMKLCKRTIFFEKGQIKYIGETYKAVQKYLNIPFIESNEIAFLKKQELTGKEVLVENGQTFIFQIEIEKYKICTKKNFSIGFSIERHIEGIGWSLAMTGTSNVSFDYPGITKVYIKIHDFCLAPGDYLLCLFITSEMKENQKTADKVYESMTWLNGNPIKLRVEGENFSKQLIDKRLKWEIN